MVVQKNQIGARVADELVFECELDAPPQKVWRALTTPTYAAAWLMPGAVEPRPGARFSLDGKACGLPGPIDCKVLAAEPPRKLRYAWREKDGEDAIDSIVTFELDPSLDGGTHLRIVHGDFVRRLAAANGNEPLTMLRAA
jgi:uncharacterized protein YndB with AHSA1/START domain